MAGATLGFRNTLFPPTDLAALAGGLDVKANQTLVQNEIVQRNYMQKVTPRLWFGGNTEQAANFCTAIFKNSKMTGITHCGEAGAKGSGKPKGMAMTVAFQREEQELPALNGG